MTESISESSPLHRNVQDQSSPPTPSPPSLQSPSMPPSSNSSSSEPPMPPPGLTASRENVLANGLEEPMPELHAHSVRAYTSEEINAVIVKYLSIFEFQGYYVPDILINHLILIHMNDEGTSGYRPLPSTRLVKTLEYRIRTATLVHGYSKILDLTFCERAFKTFSYTHWRSTASGRERVSADTSVARLKNTCLIPKPRRSEGTVFEKPIQWLAVALLNKTKEADPDPGSQLWGATKPDYALIEIDKALYNRKDELRRLCKTLFPPDTEGLEGGAGRDQDKIMCGHDCYHSDSGHGSEGSAEGSDEEDGGVELPCSWYITESQEAYEEFVQ